MLRAEILAVNGFKEAIHGMRNPMNSWAKSDSVINEWGEGEVGEADLSLMQKLFKAGTEHRKYDRMIIVYLDIEAPLYWWKEFDTYKIGTVANSCSTMHKIHTRPLCMDDFSYEHLNVASMACLSYTVDQINSCRDMYLQSKSKDDWWQLIQLLPSSYNQKRTVMLNYEVAARIVEQRKNHKLDEWHTLCDVLKSLPYFEEITEQ